jgi:hypothetical protein
MDMGIILPMNNATTKTLNLIARFYSLAPALTFTNVIFGF